MGKIDPEKFGKYEQKVDGLIDQFKAHLVRFDKWTDGITLLMIGALLVGIVKFALPL